VSATARKVVLDASAVLAWVLHERGATTVDKLLTVGAVPASVMVETLYRAQERGHGQSCQELHDDLLAMGLTVEPIIDEDTVRAAELVAQSRRDASEDSLSLGDGLCIAVAERLGLTMTGNDKYWAGVASTVKFMPFR
jgi:PIN domain nuclease of toxin-antitoxin system